MLAEWAALYNGDHMDEAARFAVSELPQRTVSMRASITLIFARVSLLAKVFSLCLSQSFYLPGGCDRVPHRSICAPLCGWLEMRDRHGLLLGSKSLRPGTELCSWRPCWSMCTPLKVSVKVLAKIVLRKSATTSYYLCVRQKLGLPPVPSPPPRNLVGLTRQTDQTAHEIC